jgi:hypothetical protein
MRRRISLSEFGRRRTALSIATVDEPTFVEESKLFGSEARLSWVLAEQAGLLDAIAFTHSAGYFLTYIRSSGHTRQRRPRATYCHADRRVLLEARADVISADRCRGSSGAGEADGPRSRRP